MSKPIKQRMEFRKPIQFIGILKKVQGVDDPGDVVGVYPMVDSYSVEVSEDSDEMVIRLKMSDTQPPEDWMARLCFQNSELPSTCEHGQPVNTDDLLAYSPPEFIKVCDTRIRRCDIRSWFQDNYSRLCVDVGDKDHICIQGVTVQEMDKIMGVE